VTDRRFCQVLALEPTDGDATDGDAVPFTALVNVTLDGVDFTLSTVDRSGIAVRRYPPDAAAVAPGIEIDLRDCRGSCAVIVGDDGAPAVQLFDVQVSTAQSHLVVFHGRNIPDCRYIPDAAECIGKDAVIGPPPGLPPLLVSPQVRAQAQKDFRFGVVFGRTEEGVVFIDTFEVEWDVAGLSGSEPVARSATNCARRSPSCSIRTS
jgi:hypothetical protein